MKIISLVWLSLAIFVLSGFFNNAWAAQCCSGFGDCTITVSPCNIGGDFTGRNISINVNTAAPVRIILTSDLTLAGSNLNLENQFSGASKRIVIDGSVAPGITGNAKSLFMTGGDITFPSGGLEINLSVPSTSTGNGGKADIVGATGTSTFTAGADLFIYTYAGNANNVSPAPNGGNVNIVFTSDTLLSNISKIKTGANVTELVNGGNITLTGNGNIGVTGSVGLIDTSSSNKAGNIDITGNGSLKSGLHANSCTTGNPNCTSGGIIGGTITKTGSGNYYAPTCNGHAIEAKNQGILNVSGTGAFDLPADTTTGGGIITMTGTTISDCTCINIGGNSCRTNLDTNNNVNFVGVTCDPAAFVPFGCGTPVIDDVTSVDGFYKAGTAININVIFNNPVAVNTSGGSPVLELETGAVNPIKGLAAYSGKISDNILKFTYIVRPGDDSPALDYTGTNALKLNGATIGGAITLPAPLSPHSLSGNNTVIIDTQIPSTSVFAFNKNDVAIVNNANIAVSDASTVKILSISGDNRSLYMNTVSWTTDNWVNINQVNCGSSTFCWVRVDITPISFSVDGITWQNCGGNPACTITSPVGPFAAGIVKYRSLAIDSALNSNISGNQQFSINLSNLPPNISISKPDGGMGDFISVGDVYNIVYSLFDPDNSVNAAFYYDTNNTGLDGVAINGACSSAPEGANVTCAWDTTGVIPGSYYVYGITSDGINPPDSAYSPGLVTISAVNNSPNVDNLTFISPTTADLCNGGANYEFRWTYSDPDGDVQSKLELQIDNNSDFSSPTVDRIVTNPPVNPIMNPNRQQVLLINAPDSPGLGKISYGVSRYYWRVQVWDNKGSASGWKYPLAGPFQSFVPPAHFYPNANFSFTPFNPSPVDNVLFTPASNAGYGPYTHDWDFEYNSGIDLFNNPSPMHNYSVPGNYQVYHRVTDSDGNVCGKIMNIIVSNGGSGGLKWEEVTP